ncbi:unnamed protein product [Urochloa humidicola]
MDVMNDGVPILILKQVGSHVPLICAAGVCRWWRRAIADAAFLRRYRSLHAPSVVGSYHNPSPSSVAGVHRRMIYGPVFYPSSRGDSPPLTVNARHWSLDFIPDAAEALTIIDSHGGLLLLDLLGCPNTVICKPLTCCYKSAPPPADMKDIFTCRGILPS